MPCFKGWLDTMLRAVSDHLIVLITSGFLHFLQENHVHATTPLLSAQARGGILLTHFVH